MADLRYPPPQRFTLDQAYLMAMRGMTVASGNAGGSGGSGLSGEDPNVTSEIADGAPKKPKEIKLDESQLAKVVLSEEKRRSILAVLDQHRHSDLIFNGWGLGEIMEYGRGMTMLFHGPPGTGKTWAAECIAKALKKNLTVVNSAKLQSQIPGEMERLVEEAFQEATRRETVVLFDECDSLLMDRRNMGQIMSSETNALLTAMERFEGVCILTTNRVQELDKALERRISLILKFPPPNREQRTAIWKLFLPGKMPLGPGVSAESLAERPFTGGLIKNAVLQAARLAAASGSEKVEMAYFEEAFANIEKAKKTFEEEGHAPSTHGYGGHGMSRSIV